MNDLELQVKKLLDNQLHTWQVVQDNYAALDFVQIRRIECLGREVLLQFNPKRIRSSAAKVDKASLEARPCFFCYRPKEQESVIYNSDFEILVNPYPIFQEHLTIPLLRHERQQVKPYMGTMLDLAKSLPSFAIFYNGPKCGASAPDHMHFQAGTREGFPVIQNWIREEKKLIWEKNGVNLYMNSYISPTTLFLVSKDREGVLELFERLYDLLEIKQEEYEPRINLLTWVNQEEWIICLFPRESSRPSCYYAEENDKILISPATVEMSGLFITPLESDFLKVTAKDLQKIWQEVSVEKDKIESLICKI
jgi:hypothetical protein